MTTDLPFYNYLNVLHIIEGAQQSDCRQGIAATLSLGLPRRKPNIGRARMW